MLRIEVGGESHDWFDVDELSAAVRSPTFANTLRSNISGYFGVPVEQQVIFDDDGLLATAADISRALQRVSPALYVYDFRSMTPEQKQAVVAGFQRKQVGVGQSLTSFRMHGSCRVPPPHPEADGTSASVPAGGHKELSPPRASVLFNGASVADVMAAEEPNNHVSHHGHSCTTPPLSQRPPARGSLPVASSVAASMSLAPGSAVRTPSSHSSASLRRRLHGRVIPVPVETLMLPSQQPVYYSPAPSLSPRGSSSTAPCNARIIETQSPRYQVNGHAGPPRSASFGRTYCSATPSTPSNARIIESQTPRYQVNGHAGPARSASLGPAYCPAAASTALCNARIVEPQPMFYEVNGHSGPPRSASFGPTYCPAAPSTPRQGSSAYRRSATPPHFTPAPPPARDVLEHGAAENGRPSEEFVKKAGAFYGRAAPAGCWVTCNGMASAHPGTPRTWAPSIR